MSSAGPGTYSGLGGSTLISTGLNDLDKLLGGGVPLGSVVLIFEDTRSAHHRTFLRCFVAEGVACGHNVCWFTGRPLTKPLHAALPRLVCATPANPAPTAAGNAESSQHELRIAWQYKRYIKGKQAEEARGLTPNVSSFQRASPTTAAAAKPSAARRAHMFDLSKAMDLPDLDAVATQVTVRSCSDLPSLRSLCNMTAVFIHGVREAAADAGAHGVSDGTACASSAKPVHATAADRTSPRPAASTPPPPSGSRITPSTEPGADVRSGDSDCARHDACVGGATLAVIPGAQSARARVRGQQAETSDFAARSTLRAAVNAPQSSVAPLLPPRTVGRVAIESLGGRGWPGFGDESCAGEIVNTVLSLKAQLQQSRCAGLVTVPAYLYPDVVYSRLVHMADVALHLNAIADDSEMMKLATEPLSCVAVLRVKKFSLPGMMPVPQTDAMLSLVRNRRTKLDIVPIEIDPTAELAHVDAEQQLTSSAASLACSQPQAGLF